MPLVAWRSGVMSTVAVWPGGRSYGYETGVVYATWNGDCELPIRTGCDGRPIVAVPDAVSRTGALVVGCPTQKLPIDTVVGASSIAVTTLPVIGIVSVSPPAVTSISPVRS